MKNKESEEKPVAWTAEHTKRLGAMMREVGELVVHLGEKSAKISKGVGWIPVTEQLPEAGVPVLVYVDRAETETGLPRWTREAAVGQRFRPRPVRLTVRRDNGSES